MKVKDIPDMYVPAFREAPGYWDPPEPDELCACERRGEPCERACVMYGDPEFFEGADVDPVRAP
jgi:hypothetical protein